MGMRATTCCGSGTGYRANPLTSYLAQAGFTVTGQSRANYTQTYLSLASTLNMSYLDGLAAPLLSSRDRRPLGHLIQHSAVFSLLKDHGYTTVLVSSDYYATARMPTADHCLCQQFRPTESDAQLLAQTPLGLFPSVVDAGYRAHRHKVEWTFDRLNEPLPGPGPHFVFAHVVAPHPPFVFPEGDGRRWTSPFSFSDGNHYRGTRDGYVEGYRRQLLAINERVRHVVEGIKRRSGDEAVIIIQSDHGPGAALDWEDATRTDLVERTGILSAFHLPGTGDDVLYDWISPVNTFRLVFDEYLGTSYGRLDDRAYFSTWSAPYRFHEVARPGQPGE